MKANKGGERKLFRLLDMLRKLSKGYIKTSLLSLEYGVTERTIERDLNYLCAIGYPLENIRDNDRGWIWGEPKKKQLCLRYHTCGYAGVKKTINPKYKLECPPNCNIYCERIKIIRS